MLGCVLLFPVKAQESDTPSIRLTPEQKKELYEQFKKEWTLERRSKDWAKFSRYEKANDTVKKPVKVVFMGNSITDGWYKQRPGFFDRNGFTGRGISGQTTSEMLVRFQSDVIDLKPKVVVILAGTNDLARNNGIISHRHILQNIRSMCELAKVHKIRPVLCSILPAYQFRWNKELKPAEEIKAVNEMIREYAGKNGFDYVDYYSALVDERGGLPGQYSKDGVHPTPDGYAVMEPIILRTVRKYVK